MTMWELLFWKFSQKKERRRRRKGRRKS